jgi:hypothetical protein
MMRTPTHWDYIVAVATTPPFASLFSKSVHTWDLLTGITGKVSMMKTPTRGDL